MDLEHAQNVARPVVLRILRDHADDTEDVLQNAAIRAIKNIDKFRGESLFSTWFTRIAIRTALMYRRSPIVKYGDRRVELDFDSLYHPSENPEDLAIRAEHDERIRIAVHHAINRLPRAARLAARRWLHEEKTINNAEKAARHNARVKMREILSAA